MVTVFLANSESICKFECGTTIFKTRFPLGTCLVGAKPKTRHEIVSKTNNVVVQGDAES